MTPEKRKYEKTAPQVLAYLALRKANRWEIAKKLNKSYSNIYNTVNRLLSSQLIRISNTKRGKKNPKIEVQFYETTLNGLFLALKLQPSLLEKIDQIADSHRNKLIMFREWKNFTQGEKEVIKKKIEAWFNQKILSLDRLALFSYEDEFRKAVDDMLIAPNVCFSKDLYEVTKRNPNLRKRCLARLYEQLEEDKKLLEYSKQHIAELESL